MFSFLSRAAPQPDHYAILAVAISATPEQIQRAYRELAKRLHPDVSKAPDATERFAEISLAYEILSDPARRRAYDQSRLKRTVPRASDDDRAPHYSWTNIADRGARAKPFDSEAFEDVWTGFFEPRQRDREK